MYLQFFSTAYIFKTLTLFSKLYPNPRIAHKIHNTSHLLQNITNTFQKQTFANTFAIILISVRLLVYLKFAKLELLMLYLKHFNCAEVQLKMYLSVFDCAKVKLLQVYFR